MSTLTYGPNCRRLNFRALPRTRARTDATDLATALSKARKERLLTQQQLAQQYGLSLRVIRDLEQGKLTASLQHVIAIFEALGRKVTIS